MYEKALKKRATFVALGYGGEKMNFKPELAYGYAQYVNELVRVSARKFFNDTAFSSLKHIY